MVLTLLQVALGGALGAAGRYLCGVTILRAFGAQPLPLGVIFVNVLGSLAMGVLVVTLGQKGWAHLNPFLATGVLGGFTTFSSFSLETWTLMQRGETALAAAYVLLSVGLSLGALLLGVGAARMVLA